MLDRMSGGRAVTTALSVLAVFGLMVSVAIWLLTEPFVRASHPATRPVTDPQRAARLEATVRALSERFFPRDHSHVDNLDAVARYISDELRPTGATVSEQTWQADGRTYRNVIARFGGDGTERVIVGAHYDACGEENPGADDNASGVAGLLELARRFAKDPPSMPVELLAWSLEEPPYFRTAEMGSAVHARSLAASGIRVRAMISLEMIGYFSDDEDSQGFPISALKLLYPTKGNYISIVGKLGQSTLVRRIKSAMKGASSLPVYSISAPRQIPGIDFSDHLNYWDEGWPAVMITDTAFYRNQNYHTENDKADHLNYEKMGQVIDGAEAAIRLIAK
jgi:hypothetical protein